LLARENPFAREVDAEEEEESKDPLAFAKSGFSSVVFMVVFIIAMVVSCKKEKETATRARKVEGGKVQTD
jgi:hypothetical protein